MRIYAFGADVDNTGTLPLIWGDRRVKTGVVDGVAQHNNRVTNYSKFTPPTIAHGTVISTER